MKFPYNETAGDWSSFRCRKGPFSTRTLSHPDCNILRVNTGFFYSQIPFKTCCTVCGTDLFNLGQEFSSRPLTAVDWAQSWFSSCVIWGEKWHWNRRFSERFRISLSVFFHHCLTHIHFNTCLFRSIRDRRLVTLRNAMFFRISESTE